MRRIEVFATIVVLALSGAARAGEGSATPKDHDFAASFVLRGGYALAPTFTPPMPAR